MNLAINRDSNLALWEEYASKTVRPKTTKINKTNLEKLEGDTYISTISSKADPVSEQVSLSTNSNNLKAQSIQYRSDGDGVLVSGIF